MTAPTLVKLKPTEDIKRTTIKAIKVKAPREKLGDHGTPGDLLELHEVLEFKAATAKRKPLALAQPATLPGKALAYTGSSPIVTRAQWGARAPKGAYSRISPTHGSTLHWEGPHMGAFGHDQCASKVRGIQAFHMNSRGWTDIAYSALVCPHGYIFQGRWMFNRTAANGTSAGNDQSYAICYLGGENDPFTDAGKRAFLDCIRLFDQDGNAGSGHRVHAEWKATACAGPQINTWERNGLPAPGGYSPSPSPTPTPPAGTGVNISNAVGFLDNPTNEGGWMLDNQGGIYTLAPSDFFGSLGGVTLNAPITGGVATPTGKGYWLCGADGGVFTFGDAVFRGTHPPLGDEYRAGQRRIIGMGFQGNPADPSTWGYVLVSNRLEGYIF